MPDVQGFWSTIGSLAIVLGLIVVAIFWVRARSTKPSGGIPLPDGGVVAPKPAPSYHGFLSLKPNYDEGERLIFQTTQQVAGCLGETVSYGIDDNGTGPYGVMVRAWRDDTKQEMPVYGHDGRPQCNGVFVPSGVFDVYLCGKRPYSAIGSLIGCDVFVPYKAQTVVFVPSLATSKACNPPQQSSGGTPSTVPAEGQIAVLIEVTPMNQHGQTSGPYLQTVIVQKQIC
jgi:hypothetical protein